MKKMMMSICILFLGLGQNLYAQEEISVVQNIELEDGRVILANSAGLTLYTFDVDGVNISNCHGGCLTVWPAAIVEDSELVKEPYGVISRANGDLQLTLNSQPLYTFVGDKNEGDITGDGLQGVWHIISNLEEE